MDGIDYVNFYQVLEPAPCYRNNLKDGEKALDEEIMRYVNDLTIEKCIIGCQERGYLYAGVGSGTFCHCGHDSPSSWRLTSESDCRWVLKQLYLDYYLNQRKIFS